MTDKQLSSDVRQTSVNRSPQLVGGNSDYASIQVSDEIEEWIDSIPESADSILAMERIRRDNPDTYGQLMKWTTTLDRSSLILALVQHRSGLTYADLESETGFSYGTLRHYIEDLAVAGIVETKGYPLNIRLTDFETYVLAVDALAYCID